MTDLPEQFTREMISQIDECAKQFLDEQNAIFIEQKNIFSNKIETFDNILSHNIDIYFNNYILRFCYYPHMSFSTSHSVLTCYVSLDKSVIDRVYYPLSQLFGLFGICPKNSLVIPLILTAESMKECFQYLTEAFVDIMSKIEDLSYDFEQKQAFFEQEFEAAAFVMKREFPTLKEQKDFIDNNSKEWFELWKSEQSEIDNEIEIKEEFNKLLLKIQDVTHLSIEKDKKAFLEYYYILLLAKSVSPAYEAYMTGNYTKALKKFRKQKYITTYEIVLIEYLDNAKTTRPHIPQSIYKNLTVLYKNGIPKNNIKEVLMLIFSMLIFGAMMLPLFLIVYFILYFLENRDALYLLGSLENAVSAMLPSIIFGAITLNYKKKWLYKIFHKKNYQEIITLDSALDSRSYSQFMKWFTRIIIVCSVFFLALTVHQNIKLTDTGFYDNSEFWSINGKYYSYDEVSRLSYREQTTTEYSFMMDIPSYVIILKNGDEIDPYRFNSCDEKFLNVFRDKGIFVEYPPVNQTPSTSDIAK